MHQPICENLNKIKHEIGRQETLAGRQAGSVTLLAVSKTKPASVIAEAHACGQQAFGENYAQELAEKSQELSQLPIQWHFIGPLQSNKTRLVAEHAHWVHSIERLKIARRLSEQRPEELPPLQVCIQVNVDEEASKAGVTLDEVRPLAQEISQLPRLQLRGLMCIPTNTGDQAHLHQSFGKLRQALEELTADGFEVDTLSMGMSHDFPVAIAEGATMVRVGTAIFGARG